MRLLTLLILFFAWLPVHGQDSPDYWDLHGRGWYWGENAPVQKPVEAPSSQVAGGSGSAAPPLFSAEWFQKNLDHYREAAIDNPTQRNVQLYLYLQRVALDKASAFSAAAKLAVYNDPALDQGTYSPTSAIAKATVRQQITAAESKLLQRLGSQAGIWFFFRSDCPYCAAQEPILETFARLYHFSILPISLDGKPMPDGRFPEFVNDTGQAAQLGVTATPTMFLVSPPDKVLKIAEGVQAGDQLSDRIVELGHQNGWVTDEEFAGVQMGAPQNLQDGLPGSLPTSTPPPDQLLDLLRSAALQGKSTPITTSRAAIGASEE